jgi:hypothetical protein
MEPISELVSLAFYKAIMKAGNFLIKVGKVIKSGGFKNKKCSGG